jgi:hypothetical protein
MTEENLTPQQTDKSKLFWAIIYRIKMIRAINSGDNVITMGKIKIGPIIKQSAPKGILTFSTTQRNKND